jgi:histidyl-tRNA synthetase
VKAELLVNKRIQKHFDYATKERIFWMILVDEKQIKDGTVQLKRLEAGKYVNISNPPRENFVEELKKWLKTEVLVSILGNDVRLAGELADELWDARVKADFLVSKREQKHLDYATKERIPWMILVDEQQIKNGTVQLKHLEAGKYVNISNPRRENFVEELQTHLTQSSKSSAGPETKLQKEKDAYQMQPLQQQIRD